jgi:hypothetical protein
MDIKSITLRCDDHAETLVFTCYECMAHSSSGETVRETDYEINIEDSYCGGDFRGIKGRVKRAWHAFWAKPIYYSGIYTSDKDKVRKWLTDCLALLEQEGKE